MFDKIWIQTIDTKLHRDAIFEMFFAFSLHRNKTYYEQPIANNWQQLVIDWIFVSWTPSEVLGDLSTNMVTHRSLSFCKFIFNLRRQLKLFVPTLSSVHPILPPSALYIHLVALEKRNYNLTRALWIVNNKLTKAQQLCSIKEKLIVTESIKALWT